MAIPVRTGAFVGLGLLLIIVGTGLLKPNISTMVGKLYPQDDDARRDAGFSIFYLGINIGAFVAPIVVGWLAQERPLAPGLRRGGGRHGAGPDPVRAGHGATSWAWASGLATG